MDPITEVGILLSKLMRVVAGAIIRLNKHHDNTFFLHARCHIRGRVEVSYTAGSGILKVACRECGKVIADVKVAEE